MSSNQGSNKYLKIVQNEKDTFEEQEDSDTSPIFLGAEHESTQDSKEFALRAFVKEFAKQIDFIIDTGANVTCIFADSIPSKLRDKLEKTDKIIIQ